jgi:AraC family transcriptional regulator
MKPLNQQLVEREYKSRINKTFDYIEKNLESQFTLEEIADVAGFSKYHFNRIFYGCVGETPFQFIQRLRLERAASLIVSRPHLSITEIAFSCGFNDLAVFSRNFKSHFGKTATEWRNQKHTLSNISKTNSKKQQSDDEVLQYFCQRSKTIKWRTNMELNKSVEVKELPTMTVAYVRYTGPYKGNEKLFEELWTKLFTWAGPRGLTAQPDLKSLIIYHDDPNITVEDKLRMSVCISVPPNTKTDGEVGKMEVEGGKYVIARFELKGQQFQQAWEWVYGEWFPKSGYQPDDKPCFEMYPEEPKDGKFTVDICVPVKPL